MSFLLRPDDNTFLHETEELRATGTFNEFGDIVKDSISITKQKHELSPQELDALVQDLQRSVRNSLENERSDKKQKEKKSGKFLSPEGEESVILTIGGRRE